MLEGEPCPLCGMPTLVEDLDDDTECVSCTACNYERFIHHDWVEDDYEDDCEPCGCRFCWCPNCSIAGETCSDCLSGVHQG